MSSSVESVSRGLSTRLVCLLGVLAIAIACARPVEAANPKINVAVGQSITQDVASPIKTVSIADSKVADVVVAGPLEILVNGKAVGFTTLVVWDQNNRSTIYNVVVRGAFSDQQIELRVKIAEVNKSRALELGMDFLFQEGRWTGGAYPGEVATPSIPLPIFNGQAIEGTSLALRYMFGGTDVSTMIHALQSDGVLRVLAEPNVVAASGQNASFLSGGELPIPIASSGAQGGSNITVEFKEFGVKVDFLPTIVDSGVINLKVAPEVSSLDFNNGVVLAGFRVPSLRTRRAETTVELKDGEVLVIGGLIMEESETVVRKIPVLGHIPLVGLLFSNKQTMTTETELLLVVSPHIIRALPRGTDVALPGTNEEG